MTGTIARMTDKGFGFIQNNSSKDFFFHRDDYLGNWQDLIEEVNSGARIEVEFKEVYAPKGPRAQNVRKLDDVRESLGDA